MLLVGISAGSVEPLPHVKKYQSVIPQRLKDPSPINDAAAHQVRHKLLFNQKQIVWKVDRSGIVSLSVWTDVPRCSAVLSDYYSTKLHSASGKEQVRTHHTLGQSLQTLPSFRNVIDLSVYPFKKQKILFRYLVGNSFTVTHFSDQGTQVTTTPDLGVSSLFFRCKETFLSLGVCVIKPTQHHMQTNLSF